MATRKKATQTKQELCDLYEKALDEFQDFFRASKEALKNARAQKNGEEPEDSSPQGSGEDSD